MTEKGNDVKMEKEEEECSEDRRQLRHVTCVLPGQALHWHPDLSVSDITTASATKTVLIV